MVTPTPTPAEEKEYQPGKHTEELKSVPQSSVGWRVSLTCDKLPDIEGEVARVTVYHLRNGEYHPVRSISLEIPKGGLKKKDGSPATEFFIGGEYPFELEALDKDGQPTKDSFDADDKPIYRYIKGEEFKVEIDSKIEFTSAVTVEAVESAQVRGLLPGVPTRTIMPDGSFRL